MFEPRQSDGGVGAETFLPVQVLTSQDVSEELVKQIIVRDVPGNLVHDLGELFAQQAFRIADHADPSLLKRRAQAAFPFLAVKFPLRFLEG